MKLKLGQLLVQAGVLTEAQLRQALEHQRQLSNAPRLGETVVSLGFASEERIVELVAKHLAVACVDLEHTAPDPDALALMTRAEAIRRAMIPTGWEVSGRHRRLVLAMADPQDLNLVDELQFRLGVPVKPTLATARQVTRAIERAYPQTGLTQTTDPLPRTTETLTKPAPRPDPGSGSHPGALQRRRHSTDETTEVTPISQVDGAPAAKRVKVTCTVASGPHKGRMVTVLQGGSMLFGRGHNVAVKLDDGKMSREHFRIDATEAGAQIIDLGSRNGTYVNKRPIARVTLQHGDLIRAGTTDFQIAFDDS